MSSPINNNNQGTTRSNADINQLPPPIVYTIAGSDSGGGAGIQADLKAIHALGCHGCSAITCLTAQNSVGVQSVHTPPMDFFRSQLHTLWADLPPRSIKIGMLGTKELVLEVADFLKKTVRHGDKNEKDAVFVVLDPVMISTSGSKLIDDEAKEAIIKNIFPFVDLVTPNKFEAEELLGGRILQSMNDVEDGAKNIIEMGARAVLMKGGHSFSSSSNNKSQDFFLSSVGPLKEDEERLCDGCRGVWIETERYDTIHTHGTGCTLSSAIASAMALGHQQRELNHRSTGACRAIQAIDACCVAKGYIAAGIERGLQLGKGPGPVVHTCFVTSHRHYPSLRLNPSKISFDDSESFRKMYANRSYQSTSMKGYGSVDTLGKILPIVGDLEWVEKLCRVKHITDIQLRIKDENDEKRIESIVQKCQNICSASGVRLWVNDFWKQAVKAKCFGVHVGQEDLTKCAEEGGLIEMKKNNMALGISTHSYAELSAAIGMQPSYISLGPIFGTSSKKVDFYPQGISTIQQWRNLIDPEIPLVAIGGINDPQTAKSVNQAGSDCIAVIGAITKADDVDRAVQNLINAMES